jgi:hypothetical protein
MSDDGTLTGVRQRFLAGTLPALNRDPALCHPPGGG